MRQVPGAEVISLHLREESESVAFPSPVGQQVPKKVMAELPHVRRIM